MSTPLNDSHPDVIRCQEAAQALGEHFDSVQVFATRHEEGTSHGTINIHVGVGNWFARFGQVRDWVVKKEEETKVEIRKMEEE